MALSSEASERVKLPLASNMDQLLNRISLGLAKHERVLKILERSRPARPPGQSQETSSRSSAGFSSLSSAVEPTSRPAGRSTAIERRRISHDTLTGSSATRLTAAVSAGSEDPALALLPPNAGLGWSDPASSTSSTTRREDGILRHRLLGRRGRIPPDLEHYGAGGRGAKRSTDIGASESEEDEGRSALGRAKRRRTASSILPAPALVHDQHEETHDHGTVVGVAPVVPANMVVHTPSDDGMPKRADGDREKDSAGGRTNGEEGSFVTPVNEESAPRRKRKKRKKKMLGQHANVCRDE
ncbi:hypothetical protein VTK73DRAFT_7819 [Phialemonium thermophilum]|uniref:Uncharacterized protein n=1 Tax=Phialemonium thermophilum TaxID=223376 RepID=A0ABR3XSL5_9PEZI